MNDLGVIILAAGLGKRMRSDLPKVLHRLGGQPLLLYPLSAARKLRPRRLAVVIGHGAEEVQKTCADPSVEWVVQENQRGTAHAVGCCREFFRDFTGEILVLSGDVPMVTAESLGRLVELHRAKKAAVTLMTAELDEPAGYGRIVRGPGREIARVVEDRDADEAVKNIAEINAGIYVVAARLLFSAVAEISDDNDQGEYYLPDIVALALRKGDRVATLRALDGREIMGVNTRKELARMERSLRERINEKWMGAGVTIEDPETTYIDGDAVIGRDTIIGPNTHVAGKSVIGARCRIDGDAFLTDTELGEEVHLKPFVVLTGARVARGATIGPFAHLRPGTAVGADARVGNFVETKEAIIGEGAKANHLAYLGDVTVGRQSNIGAGTITCNYDGFAKYRTTIGDRVMIGSDSTLVAPISVGDDAYVATATTLRHDVPAGALVYNEKRERIKEGWTAAKRKRMAKPQS